MKKFSIITLTLLLSLSSAFADFAGNTPIELESGRVVAISNLQRGDKVITLASDSSVENIRLKQNTVTFSAGTEGSGRYPAIMVYIQYGDQELIVSQDQVFPLASGKYTTASKLTPGSKLILASGGTVVVNQVSVGSYSGSIHHIAVSPNTNIANTLSVNGILVGSYLQQIYYNELADKDVFTEIKF